MVTIVPIDTPTLGDRSYLAHDGRVALRGRPAARHRPGPGPGRARPACAITHVFETHIHNDYVTGGLALAQATGAAYHVNAADDGRPTTGSPVRDGDVVEVGPSMRVRVLATPGHTFTHLSYALDATDGRGRSAVFTGGSLLFGSTGRPDLLGPDHTHDLVHHQYASAHRLADRAARRRRRCCPPTASAASARPPSPRPRASTIGAGEAGQPGADPGRAGVRRRAARRAGRLPGLLRPHGPGQRRRPRRARPVRPGAGRQGRRCAAGIEAGEWVVDLRTRTAFAAGHVAGTLNFGLDGQFATYLGWLIPWGTPLTLLGETARAGRRGPARAGPHRHRPARRAPPPAAPEQWTDGPLGRFERATFADLAQVRHHRAGRRPGRAPRRRSAPSRHIDGAVHIPLHELLEPRSTRSPPARSGCTAPAATAPPSPRRSWPPTASRSSPSTTPTASTPRAGLPWPPRRASRPAAVS